MQHVIPAACRLQSSPGVGSCPATSVCCSVQAAWGTELLLPEHSWIPAGIPRHSSPCRASTPGQPALLRTERCPGHWEPPAQPCWQQLGALAELGAGTHSTSQRGCLPKGMKTQACSSFPLWLQAALVMGRPPKEQEAF